MAFTRSRVCWFEHQWGNFRNTEQARYFWGYARFDNGDTITWRQYYGNPAGKLTSECRSIRSLPAKDGTIRIPK